MLVVSTEIELEISPRAAAQLGLRPVTTEDRGRALYLLARNVDTINTGTLLVLLDEVMPALAPLDRIESLHRVQRRLEVFGIHSEGARAIAYQQADRHDRLAR